MIEYKRGMKAGIVSGSIAFIIGFFFQIPLLFITYNDWYGSYYYTDYYGLETDVGSYVVTTLFSSFFTSILGGIIGGLIFGLIYAHFYDRLPSKSSRRKGLILGLIIWFIFGFIPSFIIGAVGFSFLSSSLLFFAGLIQYSIFGLLIGTFWDKYGSTISHTTKSSIKKDVNINLPSRKKPEDAPQKKKVDLTQEKLNEISTQLRGLKERYPSINVGAIYEQLKNQSLNLAEAMMKDLLNKTDEFEQHKEDLNDIQMKIRQLTDRLADGKIDSEAYKRASNDLEQQKSELEEKIWKLRNDLFKDDYEKPF